MGRRRRRSSSTFSIKRRTTESLGFDEFGFAHTKGKDRKLQHRCHHYSYPQLNARRVKELCELLSYWNGSSFICRSQIERFMRMGIPPALRGRVWKCLLNIDKLRESSAFNYQKCLDEIRGPLVDLGVSEYGIISAIATLNDTENDLGSNRLPSHCPPDLAYSSADVTIFRQIALDLQRSFPTHRTLMGESPEAIEGQAKLFRVLIAYAKYNPKIGYSQGMSYIAAVLLMNLSEEEAFWALGVLLEKPKYLSELFDLSGEKIQHQAMVFHQFLKHRKPQLSKHIEDVRVSPIHFVIPWFLTLFTSLPCWDSVLAIWDLIMLHGLSAVFRTGLTIIQLLESRLMNLTDEAAVLPMLLRVPVDVSQHCVLLPALWSTEVQEWEIKCMNSLVLEETEGHHPGKNEKPTPPPLPTKVKEQQESVDGPTLEAKNPVRKDSSASGVKNVFTRLVRMAQCYLLDKGCKSGDSKPCPSRGTSARHRSSKASSLTQSQIRTKRRSQKGVSQQGSVSRTKGQTLPSPTPDSDGPVKDRPEPAAFRRMGSGPVGRVARRRSSLPLRVESLRLLRTRTPQSPSPLSSPPPSSPAPSLTHQSRKTALSRELSSRCNCLNKTTNPLRNTQESQLI
ncbi:TBC1 domain family member 10B isoform X2 [Coregonus clupeaformis]|uniref:TBC1 domain family member 10B isoform X2 n=1 Tax=Coregonus clupeaformis TaxID=59861 RepID=UPI001E1C43DF|nr:TBC1 domain family member 10B isoform X2 [Coregonus clupeaformis]